MKIRTASENDLQAILRLYRYLQPTDPTLNSDDPAVISHWNKILKSTNFRYFLAEEEEKIVSSCTLSLIPNLTRSMRPYGVIENVVTDPNFRQKGLGIKILQSALQTAWDEGCYKVMLLTGSKKEETIRFYEKAGFKRGIKTGFIAYPKQ